MPSDDWDSFYGLDPGWWSGLSQHKESDYYPIHISSFYIMYHLLEDSTDRSRDPGEKRGEQEGA